MVGTDKTTDLAVLKIEADALPTLQNANSDFAEVGEWVLAVGNPFDLTSTVTAGIISSKARDINILQGKRSINWQGRAKHRPEVRDASTYARLSPQIFLHRNQRRG